MVFNHLNCIIHNGKPMKVNAVNQIQHTEYYIRDIIRGERLWEKIHNSMEQKVPWKIMILLLYNDF